MRILCSASLARAAARPKLKPYGENSRNENARFRNRALHRSSRHIDERSPRPVAPGRHGGRRRRVV
ncbi:MAG: hypothetical protein M3478_04035, partial [Planctomycetota bacterium]|nr:hypothetical protein [Planctomycetota bacterium]